MTNKYPVLLTKGLVVFPNTTLTLEVNKTETKEIINKAIKDFNGELLVISQKPPFKDDTVTVQAVIEAYQFGTIAKVKIAKEWKDESVTIELTGLKRVSIVKVDETVKDLKELFVETKEIKTIGLDAEKQKEFKSKLKAINFEIEAETNLEVALDKYASQLKFVSVDTKVLLIKENDLINRINLIIQENHKQKMSEKVEPNIHENTNLNSGIDVDRDIQKKLKDKMDKQQKEYYLREKMRVIKEELDDDDGETPILEKYKQRLQDEPFPKEVKDKILGSIKRIETMQPGSAESSVERNYIDWMMSIPWWEESEDIKDLKFAKEILDKHHYGLTKVKERIIEYLAVKQKTNSLKGQIITLVGPPGVGKTSLAKSIAEALGKNFVKISLGGVKDESEIRGHRKTYIGSMPGRIIQGMKRAKVKNPLFLLDEIDKMASDQRGDPASAMLEVLDPEQNMEFSDHYIEEPYDLSKVMFIATANYPDDIPEALYDRMEIINLSSYTEIEKMKIAKDYLVEKVLQEHSLTVEEIEFKDEAFDELIKYYTREAGVRQLERLLSSIARKFVVKLLNKEITKLTVTREIVNEYLGKRIFDHTEKQEASNVGVVTGLAYTQFGGDILPIEVTVYPGKGELQLTGKLGEVMRESATIALTYVKSNAEKFGIDKEIFKESDIHVHVPEGAVPKDGPSAGITMTTALISALSNKPVSKEIGMTGEITLRGNVLPIGGLREKSISASRSGLKKIIIPAKNIRDLDEIPDEVKSILEIKPTTTYDEVFAEVFN